MSVPGWVYVNHTHERSCLQRPEEAIGCPGAGVTGGEPSCERWEPNRGPLREQVVFLA